MQRQFNLQPSVYFTIVLVASHGTALAVLAPLALPYMDEDTTGLACDGQPVVSLMA